MSARLSQLRRVAVLHQELEPPVINGTQKPKKPGGVPKPSLSQLEGPSLTVNNLGYKDSGADIAYVLRHKCDLEVITPSASPDAISDEGWCFPDTEDGIVDASQRGTTHLWANTILFRNHPLQISKAIADRADEILLVG